MRRHVLVTGAGGFVGSTLVRALLERGHRVRGVDNFATGRRTNAASIADANFNLLEGDICDPDFADRAVEGVDWIFHQAAIPSVPRSVDDPRRSTRANCVGTATLIDSARHVDVERFIAASSSSVYGSDSDLPASEDQCPSPESPYALSKYYTEELTRQADEIYGLGTVGLRYFNIFGPRQDPTSEYAAVIPTFVTSMLAGNRPTIYGDGEQSRDFTYIDNAVEANIRAAKSNSSGAVCNVACGDQITINELVDHINETLGTEIEPTYAEPRPGDVRHSKADLSHARESIGYEPVVDFEKGLELTIDYFDSTNKTPTS